MGAVEAAEEGVEVRLMLLLQGFDGVGGFPLDLFDHGAKAYPGAKTPKGRISATLRKPFIFNGFMTRGDRIRTCDFLVPNKNMRLSVDYLLLP